MNPREELKRYQEDSDYVVTYRINGNWDISKNGKYIKTITIFSAVWRDAHSTNHALTASICQSTQP